MGKRIDLTGKKFGRLTAIKATEQRYHGKIVWECKCDCEKTCYVDADRLRRDKHLSCGCLHKDIYFDNTYPAKLNPERKLEKNNKSGIRGVHWDSTEKKWRAIINFKKVRYHLGYFGNIKDAAKARKQAEGKLHVEFLGWYKEYKKSVK
jgi:hypothetical protein